MSEKIIPLKNHLTATSQVRPQPRTNKKKSHMAWSWIIMVIFLMLSILDLRFGLGAVLCMTMPMVHALRGHGKIHCSHYCPRGSLFGRFLQRISLRNTLPNFMRTRAFKNGLLSLMVLMLSISLTHNHHSIQAVGMALFRFMSASLAVGLVLGVFYQPRSWCQICPMGHATGLIANFQTQKKAA